MPTATKTQAHAPVRSLDQRMDALKRANDVRVKRAKLKKDLKDGRVRIEKVLGSPPEYVSTATPVHKAIVSLSADVVIVQVQPSPLRSITAAPLSGKPPAVSNWPAKVP